MMTDCDLTVQWCMFKVNALMGLGQNKWHVDYFTSKCRADARDPVVHLQQPEGCPGGDEPWSQEADAGEVPQHEQVRWHQWAADEVSVWLILNTQTSEPCPDAVKPNTQYEATVNHNILDTIQYVNIDIYLPYL